MSTDTSNDCLPDWVAEHQARFAVCSVLFVAVLASNVHNFLQSPWLESQVVDSSTNSDDQDADQLAGKWPATSSQPR